MSTSSFTALLSRCKSMKQLHQIHSQITTSGLAGDNYLASKLLLFSAVSASGDIAYSLKLFTTLPSPNTFVFNIIIRGFSISKTPARALALFLRMLRAGLSPDHLTFPFLAKSCGRLSDLPLSSSMHCASVKTGFDFDLFVGNSLIHMYASCFDAVAARNVFDNMHGRNLVSWNAMVDGYAKCWDLIAARELFDEMPERDVVSWSAMIDGYVRGREYREALVLFDQMIGHGLKANAVTMVSTLCACAHLGALDEGRRMHQYLKDNGLRLSLQLSTSLVDMYSKCGSIAKALEEFRAVPAAKTDVLIWNTMIGGLAMHGLCQESLTLFDQMRPVGVLPDEITFLCLLSACAHGGLVEEAWGFFESLKARGLSPQVEHYACMVDVLGRSGHVQEAYELVRTMPMVPTASVLGALLTACRTHGLVRLGEAVGRMLIELDPEHDGRYIGLSSIYAVARRWDDAKTMREVMEKRGVRKAAGYSAVEVDGTLHRFIAHDKLHRGLDQIYLMLDVLLNQMRTEHDSIVDEQYLLDMQGDG